jgi:hypothetical protein
MERGNEETREDWAGCLRQTCQAEKCSVPAYSLLQVLRDVTKVRSERDLRCGAFIP